MHGIFSLLAEGFGYHIPKGYLYAAIGFSILIEAWIDLSAPAEQIRAQLLATPHSLFPICRGSLDEVIGVVQAKELYHALDSGIDLADFAAGRPPIVVPAHTDTVRLLDVLRKAGGRLVLVADKAGSIQGLLTPLDILEAIAGEFPDADELDESGAQPA